LPAQEGTFDFTVFTEPSSAPMKMEKKNYSSFMQARSEMALVCIPKR
jgi:hypothetical protein